MKYMCISALLTALCVLASCDSLSEGGDATTSENPTYTDEAGSSTTNVSCSDAAELTVEEAEIVLDVAEEARLPVHFEQFSHTLRAPVIIVNCGEGTITTEPINNTQEDITVETITNRIRRGDITSLRIG